MRFFAEQCLMQKMRFRGWASPEYLYIDFTACKFQILTVVGKFVVTVTIMLADEIIIKPSKKSITITNLQILSSIGHFLS